MDEPYFSSHDTDGHGDMHVRFATNNVVSRCVLTL